MALPNHQFTSLPDLLQIYISSDLIMRQMIIPQSPFHTLKRQADRQTPLFSYKAQYTAFSHGSTLAWSLQAIYQVQ